MSPHCLSLLVAFGVSFTAAVEVSVCRDATYDISVDATSLCSGSGAAPAGWSCPKAGDVAVADCLSTLASHGSGTCVAPEDAVCQVVNGDTWGCVLPSVGCNTPVVAESACETWDYSGDDTVDSSGSFDGNEDYDETWFMKTTELRELYDCSKKPTPAPTTPCPTPAATETNTTEAPTATAAPAPTDSSDTDPVTSAPTPTVTPIPMPTEVNGSSSGVMSDGVAQNRETEVGDEESAAGTHTVVAFAAADAASFGGLSNEVVAVIAAVAAFVAVIVAAVAIVYASKRHAKEDVEEGGEKDESSDEGEEKEGDVGEDAEDEAGSTTYPVAPPTPAVVMGEMATTPVAASAKAKVTSPVTTPAVTSSPEATVETSSDHVSESTDGDKATETSDTPSSQETIAKDD
ncbi:hypothetical protein GN958_ATG13882 [Phytophthora infestans]|uniref:Carbohydrate-binding protein n=1 Tax=Phytophthora infestans TaxID=4787 RepID=A0A8S9UBM8_PHYIN|nr:hypothetical protein GN958_ATG13882 [Phytophthora infestans]